MLKNYLILTITFILSALASTAEIVNIGIYNTNNISSIIFHPEEGNYIVFTEKGKLLELDKTDLLELKLSNNQIIIKSLDKDYGAFKKVRFIGTAYYNSFKIKTPNSKKVRIYQDNLFVNPHPYDNFIQLINNIDINNYIAGVVEAEVGRSPPPEYFKLQAIICRTYALKNIKRHESEGFSLCDKVHCQAYHGKPKSVLIQQASVETSGIVIVDSDINLITATFYSNCGGETANSEEVWRQELYYLRAIKDTFCLKENNAVWSKKILATAWESYLKKYNADDSSLNHECGIEYFQNGREQYYFKDDVKIPFVDIRQDFSLKSAQFDVIPTDNYVVLNGKGFGHGVGLCQEGAMRMAKLGYNYAEILHFYYRNVHMINLESLAFFKADF
jgi:stage II sporulation protein D